MVPVSEIIPYVNNPKVHPEEQIAKIASSIKHYGFTVPLVIDEGKEIIMGHGRLEAAKQLGIKEVPCIIRDDLTDSEARALRIADNKVTESDWDNEILAVEMEMLEEDMDDVFTGFEIEELEALMGDDDEDASYWSDFEEEMDELDGMEDKVVKIIVPAEHEQEVKEWLADGEPLTGPGMGRGVLKKCGLL